jgi:hypothetical protein
MEYKEWLYPFLFFLILGGGWWILSWLEYKFGEKEEDTTHHDQQPYSHYSISQQVQRDNRKERGY